jgi:type IV secretory pathway VirB9-like protein
MYRLWKDWNTKPWEYNGGIIYPEDINAVLKMEEMEKSAERFEQEKNAARADFRARRGRGV